MAASVTGAPYGGTPGRIVVRQGTGGRGRSSPGPRHAAAATPGLLIERVRLDDGRELDATEYFSHMGGHLTSHPQP